MRTQADDLVDQFWPDHRACREKYDRGAQSFEDEGVVCGGCGAVLGWPDEATTHPDLAETANDPPGDDPDGHLFDRQGPQPDPDDWPAQAAEDAMVADQPRDEEMRARFERNQFDAEARAYVQGGVTDLTAPDEQGRVGTDSSGVQWTAPPGTSDEEMRRHGLEPDQPRTVERWTSTELDTPVQPADPINAALKAIDPTKVYTPVDVEMQLVDLERRLEQGQVFQRVWEERAYSAGVAYELAWARAMNACTESSADKRKAAVTVEITDELVAKLTADHMVKAVRETMHNLRSMLSGYQSIARSIGASMSVAGAGRP